MIRQPPLAPSGHRKPWSLRWAIKTRTTSAGRKAVSKGVPPKATALRAEGLKIAPINRASQTRAATRAARDASSRASRNAVANKATPGCRTTRVAARINRTADRLPAGRVARAQDPATKRRRTDSKSKASRRRRGAKQFYPCGCAFSLRTECASDGWATTRCGGRRTSCGSRSPPPGDCIQEDFNAAPDGAYATERCLSVSEM